jgi:hypothetical protein
LLKKNRRKTEKKKQRRNLLLLLRRSRTGEIKRERGENARGGVRFSLKKERTM